MKTKQSQNFQSQLMMVACAGARGRTGGDLHASVYKSESKARGEVRSLAGLRPHAATGIARSSRFSLNP